MTGFEQSIYWMPWNTCCAGQKNLARSATTKISVDLKWYRTINWIALSVDTLMFFGEARLSHFLIACVPHLLRKKVSFENLCDSFRLQSAALSIFFSEFALPMKTISQALDSSVLDWTYEVLILIISRSWTGHHYCVSLRGKRLVIFDIEFDGDLPKI